MKMNKESIVIFGYGGHAKVVADIIKKEGKHNIAGYVLLHLPNQEVDDTIIIQSELASTPFRKGIVALGDNSLRLRITQEVLTAIPNFEFISTIHPSAQLGENITIGFGTVVMAQAAINSNTRIGNHVVINTSSTIEHDCVLEDFTCTSPRSVLGGTVKIKRLSAIGMGAIVKNNLTIGENVLVGAGSLILNNIADNELVFGSPGKKIKDRKLGDKFY